MTVILSNHPRFSDGTRFDYGFMNIAVDEGYTITVVPSKEALDLETWKDGELVGGLYGVSIGGCFFGESMFHRQTNASKVALSSLMELLLSWNFEVVDCQVKTEHLVSLGAKEIPRARFLDMLTAGLPQESRTGSFQRFDAVTIWKR